MSFPIFIHWQRSAQSSVLFHYLQETVLDWRVTVWMLFLSLQAVCCEDKLHCCPEGTKCDIAHSRCVSSSLQFFPMLQKLPARRRESFPGGGFPHVNKNKHCLNLNVLVSGQRSSWKVTEICLHLYADDTFLFLYPSAVSSVGSVTCPDGKSSCPDSFTCCELTGGDYGCCPYPEVCTTLLQMYLPPTLYINVFFPKYSLAQLLKTWIFAAAVFFIYWMCLERLFSLYTFLCVWYLILCRPCAAAIISTVVPPTQYVTWNMESVSLVRHNCLCWRRSLL